jgi:hypothetical protein
MKCKNHPEKNAIAVCQKYSTGYCDICCECLDKHSCCECSDPELYCKFRTQCIIWEISRQRRKKEQKIMDEHKDQRIDELEQQVAVLKEKLAERKLSLPMHDATPEQWQAVEEIEDRLDLKKKELKQLKSE